MKKFILTEEQFQRAKDFALMVEKKDVYKNKNSYKSHMVGRLGEIAYGLYTDISPNWEVWNYKGDDGVDFALDGAQVKTTTFKGSKKLLVRRKNNSLTEDIKKFVLAYVDYDKAPHTVYLVGEISYENFMLRKYTYTDKMNNVYDAVNERDLDELYRPF
jgi:hypothetical protein